MKSKSPTVEMIKEGYLIRGTTDINYARALLGEHAKHVTVWQPGRYRKVPGQWADFNLYKATGRGSFEGVLARFK